MKVGEELTLAFTSLACEVGRCRDWVDGRALWSLLLFLRGSKTVGVVMFWFLSIKMDENQYFKICNRRLSLL